MNSKGHFILSIVKSLIRGISCIVSMTSNSIIPLALGLLIAEFFGVFEEVVDKR